MRFFFAPDFNYSNYVISRHSYCQLETSENADTTIKILNACEGVSHTPE